MHKKLKTGDPHKETCIQSRNTLRENFSFSNRRWRALKAQSGFSAYISVLHRADPILLSTAIAFSLGASLADSLRLLREKIFCRKTDVVFSWQLRKNPKSWIFRCTYLVFTFRHALVFRLVFSLPLVKLCSVHTVLSC